MRSSLACIARWVFAAIVALLVVVGVAVAQAGWWKQNSTPGIDVHLTKTKDFMYKEARIFYYNVETKGFPAQSDVTLILQNLVTGVQPMLLGNFKVNDKGIVVNSDGSEYSLILGGISPGETFQLAVGMPSRQINNFDQVTPIPIEARDGACHLWAILIGRYGTGYEVHGDGFHPNDKVSFVGNSEGEVHEGQVPAHDDGSWWTDVLPGVKGKLSGTLKITATGTSCKLSIAAPWKAPPGVKQEPPGKS